MGREEEKQSFWDHLDVLRGVLLRVFAVILLCGIVAFVFKEELFAFVLAPKYPGFVTYGVIADLCASFGIPYEMKTDVALINTGLAQQFIIHMKTAFCAGFLAASPYVVYQLFRFVSPALYARERKYAVGIVTSAYVMFITGAALSYLVIFPMTFQFLGTYQVSEDVVNMISLESYMSTMVMLSLCMGIVCEMPVLAWMLAKAGLLTPSMLVTYRRHAIVAILIAAAIITPTSDVFTLMLVSVPMCLLYEASITVAKLAARTVRASELKSEPLGS